MSMIIVMSNSMSMNMNMSTVIGAVMSIRMGASEWVSYPQQLQWLPAPQDTHEPSSEQLPPPTEQQNSDV